MKAALARAKPTFDAGTEIVALAWRSGVRWRSTAHFSQPEWPTREKSERVFWNRPLPLPAEDPEHAA